MNPAHDEPCRLESLEALVPRWDRYCVNSDGTLGEFSSEGLLDGDTDDIEEYHCENCGEYFMLEKRYSRAALEIAWQQALDHLPTMRTSDGRIVRVRSGHE